MATSYAQPSQFEQQAMQSTASLDDQLTEIADRLQKLAEEQVKKKGPIEERWITELRAFHGKYDPKTEADLIAAEKSSAYVKITRKKANSWEARLSSLLFPTDEENWGIEATPIPTLTAAAKQAMKMAMQQLDQANAQQAQAAAQPPQPQPQPQMDDQTQALAQVQPGPDQNQLSAPVPPQQPIQPQPVPQGMMGQAGGDQGMAAAQAQQAAAQAQQHIDSATEMQAQIDEARRRSAAMFKEMQDQLVECDYASENRLVIRDAVRVGTGILKGPLAGDRNRGQWLSIEGVHVYKREEDAAPVYKWVDPWSYFPDMSAIRPEDREFEFERHIWSSKDLRQLVRERGFNKDAVRELLQEDRSKQPIATSQMNYLTNLRSITGTSEMITGRYIGWEYHGPLETSEVAIILRALGRPEDADRYEMDNDPLQEVRVIVYFCDGKILKIAPCYPLDSNESLYSLFTFEPSEASIFGYGIPAIMADSQMALNGAWRMALDNAGLSVGPQIFIDREAIEPANRRWKLEPRKIWYKKKGAGIQGEPMQAVHISNNVEEIMKLVEVSRRFIDDETALPVQAEGELTDNPNITATATNFMSMASNVTFRRVVKAFDDGITVPSIRRLYDWNMQHNSNEDIKGDMKVHARGSSALLLRELQSAMLINVTQAWTQHPVLKHAIKPYDAAAATLQSMMIHPDDLMVSNDQFQQSVKAEADAAAQMQQQNPVVIAAQTRLEATKLDGQARIQVANIQRETELMKVAQQYNLGLDELRAMLQAEKMKHDSKERLFAAEAAIEDQRTRQAREHGEVPKASGGSL